MQSMSTTLQRAQTFDASGVDRQARTITLALSSEAPYERYFGIEVLSHEAGAIDLSRLADGRHPLLINHDWERQAGVLTAVEIGQGGVLRGVAKVSRNAIGEELLNDAEDGIRTLASIGYEIQDVEITERDANGQTLQVRSLTGEQFALEMRALHGELWNRAGSPAQRAKGSGEPPLVRVTRWQPFEGSIVSIPADPSVGIGRSATPPQAPAAEPTIPQERPTMTIEAPALNASADVAAATQAERARSREITAIGEQHARFNGPALARAAIESGESLEAFRQKLANAITSAQTQPVADLGMSRADAQRFSVMKAIRAMVDRDWRGAEFEKEASDAICKRAGITSPLNGGFYIPQDVQKRDLTVAAPTGGGNLVGTELRPQNFIDLLRARAVVAQLGATMLPGLVGNVTIPKLTGAATGYWLANEATAITESQQTVGQLALTPKSVGAYTEISRLLMMQSTPAADFLVMNDLSKVIALAIDLAALEGSGAAGQPTGISLTAGIGSVTGTAFSLASAIEFQTDVASGNALTTGCAYLTTPTVAGLLSGRARIANTDSLTLWRGNVLEGQVEGYRAATTTQLTAGSMVFGDFSQVVIGEWGMLEMALNPYANFQAAISGIRAIQTVDVGIRQAAAFSRAVSIT
jgi:HK97 family phage major capsid protein